VLKMEKIPVVRQKMRRLEGLVKPVHLVSALGFGDAASFVFEEVLGAVIFSLVDLGVQIVKLRKSDTSFDFFHGTGC